MVDLVRGQFEKMSVPELLAILSFFQTDYTVEALVMLKEVAAKKGVTEETARKHREFCYAELELEFKCSKCNCEFVLDKETFIDGFYRCTECGCTNLLCYLELELSEESGQYLADIAVAAVGGLAGGLAITLRDHRKHGNRRLGIMEGTYWKALHEYISPRSERN